MAKEFLEDIFSGKMEAFSGGYSRGAYVNFLAKSRYYIKGVVGLARDS